MGRVYAQNLLVKIPVCCAKVYGRIEKIMGSAFEKWTRRRGKTAKIVMANGCAVAAYALLAFAAWVHYNKKKD